MKSILRTSLVAAICCGLLLLAYWQLTSSWHVRAIAERDAIIADMEQRLAERAAMLDRLSRSRRLAHIHVVDQPLDPFGEAIETTIEFIELDDQGAELARQRMTVPGGVLFVDAWTAKFDPGEVATGHPLRGQTLVLLRRVYSEFLAPGEGFAIDTPGAIPAGYATTDVARFEQGIWSSFWQIASNPELASRMGVRVAQGEVVYKPVRAGQRYELEVDAAGGINLTPLSPNTQLTHTGD